MLASYYFTYCWRCFTISTKENAINDAIKFKEVRVINNGVQLGVLPIAKALEAAENEGLDLVCVQPDANPPVCKILDYGKFRFEKMKHEKEAKKNQKVMDIKEIRIVGLGINDHDVEIKANNANRFLKAGNKVKVTIRFRGREIGHNDNAFNVMKSFENYCQEYGTVEKPAKIEGRNMIMFLAPKSGK